MKEWVKAPVRECCCWRWAVGHATLIFLNLQWGPAAWGSHFMLFILKPNLQFGYIQKRGSHCHLWLKGWVLLCTNSSSSHLERFLPSVTRGAVSVSRAPNTRLWHPPAGRCPSLAGVVAREGPDAGAWVCLGDPGCPAPGWGTGTVPGWWGLLCT